MKSVFSILLTTTLATMLAFVGSAQAASDSNISTVTVTADDTTISSATDYNVTLNMASTDVEYIHLFLAESPNGSPTDSTYGWSSTNLVVGEGISAIGETLQQGGQSIGYSLSVSSISSEANFTLNNIVNPTEAGCYELRATTDNPPGEDSGYTMSEPFTIGDGDCSGADSGAPAQVENAAAVVFGNNVAFTWDAYDNEALNGYSVLYSTDESQLQEGGEPTFSDLTTDTTITISDLEANTTYYYTIEAEDLETNQIAASEVTSFTTDSNSIAKQRFSKPKIKKKNTKKKTFVVNFKNWKNSLDKNEIDYVSKIYVTVGSKKKVSKKYKLNASKNKVTIKKKITKKHWKKNKKVYVQAWAKYSTGEKTKKSKKVKVQLY